MLAVARRADHVDEPGRRRENRGARQRLGRGGQPQRCAGARVVSHRMPDGVVYVYHAQERTIDVPLTETTGNRGGIHNSLTRLLVKPSPPGRRVRAARVRVQLSGPTGNQRDEVTVVRRRSQEVTY